MRNYQYVPQFQVRSDIRSGEGGGYVDGVWYPDQSGVCGGSTSQPPAPAPVPPASSPDLGRRLCRRCVVSGSKWCVWIMVKSPDLLIAGPV